MVPINLESPKAFMEVKKQPLIERIIEQLNEAGIFDISVVVGFMKESNPNHRISDLLIVAYN